MHGIASTESGHRYDAIGPPTRHGRAIGMYQVMQGNVGNWTEKYLGKRYTVDEFINDHLAQELLAGMIFTQRIVEYQNIEDAVSIWFSGVPAKDNKRCDVNMCVPEYVQSVMLSML